MLPAPAQVNVAAVAEREATEEKLGQQLDFDAIAAELDSKSPLEIMDHVSGLREAAPGISCIWCSTLLLIMLEGGAPSLSALAPSFEAFCTHLQALKTFGDEIGIAFSGAEDVALVEYAHLTGRPFRVFR